MPAAAVVPAGPGADALLARLADDGVLERDGAQVLLAGRARRCARQPCGRGRGRAGSARRGRILPARPPRAAARLGSRRARVRRALRCARARRRARALRRRPCLHVRALRARRATPSSPRCAEHGSIALAELRDAPRRKPPHRAGACSSASTQTASPDESRTAESCAAAPRVSPEPGPSQGLARSWRARPGRLVPDPVASCQTRSPRARPSRADPRVADPSCRTRTRIRYPPLRLARTRVNPGPGSPWLGIAGIARARRASCALACVACVPATASASLKIGTSDERRALVVAPTAARGHLARGRARRGRPSCAGAASPTARSVGGRAAGGTITPGRRLRRRRRSCCRTARATRCSASAASAQFGKLGAPELRFARWRGAQPELRADRASGPTTAACRASAARRPTTAGRSSAARTRLTGSPLDALGRNVYIDVLRAGGWYRIMGVLTRPRGFALLIREPAWRGSRYRALVPGPNSTATSRPTSRPPRRCRRRRRRAPARSRSGLYRNACGR